MVISNTEVLEKLIRARKEYSALALPGAEKADVIAANDSIGAFFPAEARALTLREYLIREKKISELDINEGNAEEICEVLEEVLSSRTNAQNSLGYTLRVIERTQEWLESVYDKLVASAVDENRALNPLEIKLRNNIFEWQEEMTAHKEGLLSESTDAFYAYHSNTLNTYLEQLQTGRLVETPYVTEKLEEVLKGLKRNYYILLHGDTGSGKTELAKLASRKFLKDVHGDSLPESHRDGILLRCYRGMGSEEIFGHFALKGSSNPNFHELPGKIEEAIEKWKRQNPGIPDSQSEQAVKIITEAVLKQNNTTISEYIFGAIYNAAKYGYVVILDEVNFAPPEILVKLNEFLNLKPGELVHVQEDNIPPFPMHKGFGFICTGNIDYSGTRKYGTGRFDFEPSRLNRITMIDYDYLPQAVKGDYQEVTQPASKQLFAIALASLLCKDGITALPDHSLESIWRLCRYAKLTQIAFSGQLGRDNEDSFQSAGAAIEYRPEVLISPRNLVRIIHDWRMDGFRYELDHYVYSHFIKNALKPADGALLYQLGKKQGFFMTSGWEEGISEIENLTSLPFRVKDPMNNAAQLRYYHAEEIIEAIYGKAPERSAEKTGRESYSAHSRLEVSQLLMNFEVLAEEFLKIKAERSIVSGEAA